MKNQPIIAAFQEKLGPEKILTGADVKERSYHIWRMYEPLRAKAVLLPKSTEDVSEILKICHEYHQPVVVHGGLTNMVGSTETQTEEVVISMEKMNAVKEVDEKNRSMTVQAGVILENAQNAAKERGLMLPLNFGAKGSAQMGGVIATNAGGLRVLRYGMTRNLVLGLEAVLADGTVISSMKKIIKDNSGYDVKQLFIGSEGTLGVITQAVFKLVEMPKSRTSALTGLNDYNKVVNFLKYMDSGLAGNLSAFELIWKNSYQALTSPPATIKPPLPYDYQYYVLLESLGSDPSRDQEIMQYLLEEAQTNQLILDAVVAQSEWDLSWFWKIREDVDNIVTRCNNDQHFDISLPIPEIGSYINALQVALHDIPEVEEVFPFGHVADGNVHLVIGKSRQSEALIHQINKQVYASLPSFGGSISAEHGVGLHKKKYLHLSRSAAEIQLMQSLKKALDPRGILNPGKVV